MIVQCVKHARLREVLSTRIVRLRSREREAHADKIVQILAAKDWATCVNSSRVMSSSSSSANEGEMLSCVQFSARALRAEVEVARAQDCEGRVIETEEYRNSALISCSSEDESARERFVSKDESRWPSLDTAYLMMCFQISTGNTEVAVAVPTRVMTVQSKRRDQRDDAFLQLA